MIIKKNQNILRYLQDENMDIIAPCNGKHICGKCKIKMKSKPLPNDTELMLLSTFDLENGVRLACTRKAQINDEISIIGEYSNMKVTSSFTTTTKKDSYLKVKKIGARYHVFRGSELLRITDYKNAYGIAIDIGTTTIAITLNDLVLNQTIDVTTLINPQTKYGSDVISRIDFGSTKSNLNILSTLIKKDLDSNIVGLLYSNGISEELLYEVVIAANTTMVHLLMAVDPKGLAVAPYKSELLDTIVINYSDLFDHNIDATVTIIGGFDAFVGGDIVSGIYSQSLHQEAKYSMLVDLGTNGEIVLVNKHKILATSTAAGPAFEGVNITCGLGAIDGAICEFVYPNVVKTINHQKPIGICGSGLIDIVSDLLRYDLVEKSGRMKKPFTVTDNIKITPKDIREVQLAKAAIRAGIEHLLIDARLSIKDIDKLYIAGGFGKHINLDNFFSLGIIPIELKSKSIVIGNSSLSGAVKYLFSPFSTEIDDIRKMCEIVNLGSSKLFQEIFVDNIHFN